MSLDCKSHQFQISLLPSVTKNLQRSATIVSLIELFRWRTTGCLKKFARIRCTQNLYSGYIYLMRRVLTHIYLLTFCFWQYTWIVYNFHFWVEKGLLYMYCLKSWKEGQSIRIALLLFQNDTIFMIYFDLNTIKSTFKTIWFVKTC